MTKHDKYNKSYNSRKKHESHDVHTYPSITDKLLFDVRYFLHKYVNRNIVNYIKIMITYIGRILLPIIINIFDLYQKQVPKYFKDPKNGKTNILSDANILSDTNEKHRYFGFVMLICEIYSLFFQDIIMRLWIIANFAATFLFMYQDLNEDGKNKNIIRYYLMSVIISGILLLLFFTSSIGLTSIPLMIYLINRTICNMLNESENIKHKHDEKENDKENDKEDNKQNMCENN